MCIQNAIFAFSQHVLRMKGHLVNVITWIVDFYSYLFTSAVPVMCLLVHFGRLLVHFSRLSSVTYLLTSVAYSVAYYSVAY
jgi:hypothetical protein